MTVFQLVLSEIRFRRLNFILSLLAVTVAAALFVAGPMIISGYASDTKDQLRKMRSEADSRIASMRSDSEKRLADMEAETKSILANLDKKTKRIMRDMGINLRIIHKDTVLGGLYTDFKAVPFDETDVEKLATSEKIEKIVHVVGTLQDKFLWNGRSIFVVGMKPMLTVSQKNEEKKHMAQKVEEGTVLVGFELAGDLKVDDTIEIEGQKLKVVKLMPQLGTVNDVQLLMHLHDAQKILKMPGKINQITALNCKCKGDRISAVREELEGVLPDTKVIEINNLATAREKQRDLVEQGRDKQLAELKKNEQRQLDDLKKAEERQLTELKTNRQHQENTLQSLAALMTPLVIFVAAVFVGLLTWLNVRERRPEIGLLRALGRGSMNIAGLFLGKSAILGLLGGLIGCGLGFGLAIWLGSSQMNIPSEYFSPSAILIVATILGAPLVAAMASYLPTLSAVTQDPAVVLMDH